MGKVDTCNNGAVGDASGICGLLDGVVREVGFEDIRFACASDDAASRRAIEVVEKLDDGCERARVRWLRIDEGRAEEEEFEAWLLIALRELAGSTSNEEPSVPDGLDELDEACLDAKSWDGRNVAGRALEGPAATFPET